MIANVLTEHGISQLTVTMNAQESVFTLNMQMGRPSLRNTKRGHQAEI